MSKICVICGKKPMFGNNVSHAHNITKRRFVPNLQKIRTIIDGVPQRVTVCASCIRAGKVTKNTQKRKAAKPAA